MSPEQASGERNVDGRSDVYSLGCMLYEMLAGEPPYTGPTAQAIIAKTIQRSRATSTPYTPERARAGGPGNYKGAGRGARGWVRHCGRFRPGPIRPRGKRRLSYRYCTRRRAAATSVPVIAGAAIILGLVAVAGIWGGRTFPGKPTGAAVRLYARTQLTFTGRVRSPAVSPDGKQIAFVTQECSETACAYAVEVQDVGGTTTRTVLEGAASATFIEWSPDRRNLLVTGTIDQRWGTYLVSLLGGAPRRVGVSEESPEAAVRRSSRGAIPSSSYRRRAPTAYSGFRSRVWRARCATVSGSRRAAGGA